MATFEQFYDIFFTTIYLVMDVHFVFTLKIVNEYGIQIDINKYR